MDVKICMACSQEKPLSAYTKRSGSSGRRGTCRVCLRKRRRLNITDTSKNAQTSAQDAWSQENSIDSLVANHADSQPPRKRRRKRRSKSSKKQQQLEHDALASDPVSNPMREAVTVESVAEDGEDGTKVDEIPRAANKRKRRKRRRKTAVKQQHPEKVVPSSPVNRPPDKLILPLQGPFTYKTSVLSNRGKGLIRLRGHRETGKRWSTEIPLEMAIRMVNEGAAGIISPRLIHKLYTKTDFRLLVLQRDHYICHYCGRYGDTIDHVLPKSKGGLSTPANCVCACAECNLKKADSLDFVYDDFM